MKQVEQIIAEIERRKSLADKKKSNTYFLARSDAYAELLNFIDSLQEEPVSEDLKAFIKERVKNIPIVLRSGFHELCRQLIRDGANKQKQQTIDKAAEWLKCAGKYHWYDPIEHNEGFGTDRLIEDFKKYMED